MSPADASAKPFSLLRGWVMFRALRKELRDG
jgi:hypothetical protein